MRELAPLFQRYASPIAPRVMTGMSHVPPVTNEDERHVGAVAALSATRSAPVELAAAPAGSQAAAFAASSLSTLKLIDAAVGDGGTVIRPRVVATDQVHWEADVRAPASDTFFAGAGVSSMRLCALPNAFYAASLARWAGASRDGDTIDTFVSGTKSVPAEMRCSTATPETLAAVPAGTTTLRFELALPVRASAWTFVMVRDRSPLPRAHRLLGSNVTLHAQGQPLDPSRVYVLPEGGTLNDIGERAWAFDPRDPTRPAFDGDGLPARRAVSVDPLLLGNLQGEGALGVYRVEATRLAGEATAAIATAFQTLIAARRSSLDERAEAARSLLVESQTQEELCGRGNATCERGQVTVPPWTVSKLDYPACLAAENPPSAAKELACFAYLLEEAVRTPVTVSAEVAAQGAAQVPDFARYSDGRLRKIFEDEWHALRRVRSTESALRTSYRLAAGLLQAGDRVFAAQTALTDRVCTLGTFTYNYYDKDERSEAHQQDVTFDVWRARRDWCNRLNQEAPVAAATQASAQQRAFSEAANRLGDAGLQLLDAVTGVRRASADKSMSSICPRRRRRSAARGRKCQRLNLAHLEGSVASPSTVWPGDFVPSAFGGRMVSPN